MYKIKKVPSPTGYTVLNSEIEVDNVDGIHTVYERDGELRGKISIVSIESELEISYERKYKNGKIRTFVVRKKMDVGENDFSLSEAPMFDKELESVSIVAKLV